MTTVCIGVNATWALQETKVTRLLLACVQGILCAMGHHCQVVKVPDAGNTGNPNSRRQEFVSRMETVSPLDQK